MFRRNLNSPRGAKECRAFITPSTKTCAVRMGGNLGNHKIGQVAEFVGEDVEEFGFVGVLLLLRVPIVVVVVIIIIIISGRRRWSVRENFFREFNGSEMLMFDKRRFGGIGSRVGFGCFSSPICSSCCTVQSLGPDDFDAAGGSGETGDLALSERLVEFEEEGFCEENFARVPVFTCLEFGCCCCFGAFGGTAAQFGGRWDGCVVKSVLDGRDVVVEKLGGGAQGFLRRVLIVPFVHCVCRPEGFETRTSRWGRNSRCSLGRGFEL